MIKQTSTRIVYKNRWMSVREDTTRLPDGSAGVYGVVDKPDFAAIVPLHANGTIQLVEQYRYPVAERLWELPAGAWEDNPDVDPIELARAELLEETGLRAGVIEHIGYLRQAEAVLSHGCNRFLATDLSEGPPERESTEQDMRTDSFDLARILQMIQDRRITDAVTIAALGLLRLNGRL